MKMHHKVVLASLLLTAGSLACGWSDQPGADQSGSKADYSKPYVGSPELELMKKAVGKWEGTSNMGGKEQKVQVEYRLTSGGSALEERLFPGTPHEMVTIYYDKGGKLMMTHYCMMHNQPVMELQSAGPKELSFSLAKDCGIDAAKEAHMHALTLEFPDDAHLVHKWVSMKDGKEAERTVINFTRKLKS